MSLLAAAAIALRLVNPNDVSAEATLQCGEESRGIVLDAREVRDIDGCTSATSLLPLLVLETSVENGAERQQSIEADTSCPIPVVYAPLFACRNGVATAYTDPVEGARYEWTAEGATILGAADTNRVAVQIAEATVRLQCKVSREECGGAANAN